MISTQRLLLILICLNTTLGIAADIYVQPTNYNTDRLNDLTTYGENLAGQFEDEEVQEATIRTQSTLQEPTWGSGLQISGLIVTGFFKGIMPSYFWTTQDDYNNVEQLIIGVLSLFQVLMYMIAILEAFMLYKNRKTS